MFKLVLFWFCIVVDLVCVVYVLRGLSLLHGGQGTSNVTIVLLALLGLIGGGLALWFGGSPASQTIGLVMVAFPAAVVVVGLGSVLLIAMCFGGRWN
jgi:hypothetical protein